MSKAVLNRDYIAYVYFEGNECIYQEKKIDHPNEMELIEIDCEARSTRTDYVDVQELFYKLIPRDEAKEKYRYCYPYDYNDRYIGEAIYPSPKKKAQLPQYIERIKSVAKEELSRRRRYPNSSYTEDSRSDDELNRAVNYPEAYIKEVLYKKIERWVYAKDYANALDELVSLHPDCIYTHDGHGNDHNYSRQLSEDIGFSIKSNFSYGRSAKFFVNFKYKGIDLLPYSTLVNYYYAGIEELVRYTRAYSPFRSNWSNVLNDILVISTSALENPSKFVNDWLSKELDGMMEALDDFMFNTHARISHMISHPKADAGKFLKIENASDEDINSFRVHPNRVELLCKADKVTCALKFVDSIKQVSAFYLPAHDYSHKILLLNGKLLEQVADELASVEDSIDDLQKQIVNCTERIHCIMEPCASEWEVYSKVYVFGFGTYEKRERYLRNHPLVNQLLPQVNPIIDERTSLQSKRDDLKAYAKMLSKYLVKVLDYWHSSFAPDGLCDWPLTINYQEKMSIYDRCPNEYKLPVDD